MTVRHLPLTALVALALASTGLSGCAKEAPKASDGTKKIDVVTSYYPVEYLTREIGGEHVDVKNLTKPGAEPHDLELSPKDVAAVSEASLVVYSKGFQPAVDDAVKNEGKKATLDLTPSVDLSLKHTEGIDAEGEDAHEGHDHEHENEAATTGTEDAHEGHDHEHESEAATTGTEDAHEGHDHEHESEGGHEGHHHETEAGTTDPHFWLDPVRYGKAAEAVAAKLKEVDPEHASAYDDNLKKFLGKTGDLNTKYSTGLKTCASKSLVTSHSAFGYLAQRYGFTQVSITGLSPENEPAPGQLTKVSEFTKKNKVKTIYAETLVDPKVAETVAKETGASTAVLDPIEGLNEKSAAQDYFGIMEHNLATLKKGQECR